MRRFCFTYDLTLAFSQPIARHTFLFRFSPPTDARQQLWGMETRCTPVSQLPLTRDAFGNGCACGHIEETHRMLTLSVRGDVLVRGGPIETRCSEFYVRQTALTEADARILALGEGLSGTPEEVALRIAERIHAQIGYQKGVTCEATSARQALDLGAGVCQDMAHLLLSALRARGIAARYVAGLIPGEGETHAWVDVYDGARFVGVDPTHLRLADDTYLTVNVGRDGRDCAINRGVFSGAAGQSMDVCARMTEM